MVIKADILQSEKVHSLVRYGLLLALVIWLAWMLASTVWLFVSGPAESPPLPRSMLVLDGSAGGQETSGPSASQVAAWELFGPLEQAAVIQQEAPETRLRLELLGIFENRDSDLAGAIIAEQGKDGELYHLGEKVPGNATLEEIQSDRVILLRMGQREALKMKELSLGGSVEQVSASVSRPSMQRQPSVRAQVQEAEGGVDLSQQRAMIMSNMALSAADGGGYVIGDNAPRQMLDQVGLQPGDVVLSVNGYEVGQEEADMAALREAQSAGAASIVVQRGDQRFTVNYPP